MNLKLKMPLEEIENIQYPDHDYFDVETENLDEQQRKNASKLCRFK